MPIPTELVGSLPRPMKLQEAYEDYDQGTITWDELQAEQDEAAEDSIKRLEATGEPIVTDGEQRESSFATYPITDTLAGTGLADNLAGDGQFFAIFDDGHHRQLPRLTGGPFRYKTFASEFVEKNRAIATQDVKQAVIAPSMLMLLYPLEGEIEGYSRDQFLDDLCDEVEKDIRQCFDAGAVRVSIDFTEGRLANKNDSRNPWTNKDMLDEFIDAQQPRHRPLLARGAPQHRHPHLPRRRLRLGAQQGGALREAAEQDVRPQRGLLPHPVRQRGGQGGGLPALRPVQPRRRQRRLAGLLHGRHQPARPGRRDGRAGQERPRDRGQVHPEGARWARPTTAASRRSAATSSPSTARRTSRATSRCRRSRRASRARGMASEELGV